ncbi:hypothetical protein THAOC_03544, partial [Thalassiosira oceanica]
APAQARPLAKFQKKKRKEGHLYCKSGRAFVYASEIDWGVGAMDAVVQFVRNALCTVKNFALLEGTFLYDAKVTAQYVTLPSPLDRTTPLEVLISITQFYALVTLSLAGYKMITSGGVRKLQMISLLVNVRSNPATASDDGKDKKEKDAGDERFRKVAARLVSGTNVLVSVLDYACLSCTLFNSILCTDAHIEKKAVGISFFWLFANSWHVTSTDWIGGLRGLIHALTIMELALVVFLVYMVKDAGDLVRAASKKKQFANEIVSSKNKMENVESITVEQYSWLVDGWSPFWKGGPSASVTPATGEKMITKEEEAVASKLATLSTNVSEEITDRLHQSAKMSLLEGYREYLYLLINFFAFYGYLACILVYYFNDESQQPDYIRAILFWLPNADADWTGNAVGDFAWTVEPLIVLGSPILLKSMSSTSKEKEKKD